MQRPPNRSRACAPATTMTASAGIGGVQAGRSWGRYPQATHRALLPVAGPGDALPPTTAGTTVLPFGRGRSYGDSCLNDGGSLLTTSPGLDGVVAFDRATGVLRCNAGMTLAEVLDLAVPQGWFPPVLPGTKFVSVGGAIANDIHGKNHHGAGTFGRHVLRFELLRSDGQRLVCSPSEHADLFAATIGGLGLTGLITWAEVQLKPVPGPYIAMQAVKFGSLDAYFDAAAEWDGRYEYTASWVDCLAGGRALGRGIMLCGNHAWQPHIPGRSAEPTAGPTVPFDLPDALLNPLTMRAFNTLYYHRQLAPVVHRTVPFDPFFFPLDAIGDWNRVYGGRGFLQHQCVVPPDGARQAVRELLQATSAAGQGSFLAVLKSFGDQPSPGLLSFPRPGATLALDFPIQGPATFALLDRLDAIVNAYGGAIYPAKDARMAPATFRTGYPAWQQFARHIDPAFSSSLWRRVTADITPGSTIA